MLSSSWCWRCSSESSYLAWCAGDGSRDHTDGGSVRANRESSSVVDIEVQSIGRRAGTALRRPGRGEQRWNVFRGPAAGRLQQMSGLASLFGLLRAASVQPAVAEAPARTCTVRNDGLAQLPAAGQRWAQCLSTRRTILRSTSSIHVRLRLLLSAARDCLRRHRRLARLSAAPRQTRVTSTFIYASPSRPAML